MYDIKWIRENGATFDNGLKRRGLEPKSSEILDIDARCRKAQTDLQDMQKRRNEISMQIAELKKQGKETEVLVHEVSSLKKGMAEKEEEFTKLSAEIEKILEVIPNMPAEDVPVGKDENDNVEVRKVGEPRKFDFTPKEHDEIGVNLKLIDFESAAKVSGARFVFLKGAIARLERALAQFMLDTHTEEHGYTEYEVPLLVNDATMYGTGQLPKFAEDLFKTTDGRWLIPTAEVPLTNSIAGKVLNEEELPLRITALTPCFRSEAGAAGKDTKGMIRQHQFYKVEMVSITKPEDSDKELDRMTNCAETILKKLGLPFRTICLCTGDMGFGSKRTYDVEVWMPSQNKYREISSCSTCGNFQAIRMNARYKTNGQKGTQYVHTLNGSGIAVGRALVAVLENYQQADGSVIVPEVLRKYMNGLEVIK
ncbi:MAG: Serine--tRNA ligase [Alphaproteobacteria bacterium ADurb.Bin438]|nr:MAG: Serine--tRNA ligase [Alphaproteobacteria bacterium ADurb.Bin438]